MKKIILMNAGYSKQSEQKSFHFEKKDKNKCGHENGIPEGSFQKMSVDLTAKGSEISLLFKA